MVRRLAPAHLQHRAVQDRSIADDQLFAVDDVRSGSTVIVNWTGGSGDDAAALEKRRRSLVWFREYPQVIPLYHEKRPGSG